MTRIQEQLFSLRDEAYRDFQAKLIPHIDQDSIIGVRTPELRKLAREIGTDFRRELPHRFFEENQLHAFSLERMSDFDAVIGELEAFLPFVDNWATCDQMNPKVFRKHRQELLTHIRRWIGSERPYTVRFGIKLLMDHYLDDDFDPAYLEMAAVRHEHYYVRMMVAWYFATALAKQYDAARIWIREYRLDKWVHNKTIQKAIESYRITPEQKAYLKQFRTN